jgi:RNA polymerase sigma factor (sigma-70 family)
MELSDDTLMRAARDGDISQFGVLFERHHGRLFEFFYHMTGDRSVSEDLVQDVFVRMLRYRKTFSEQSHFKSWMYQIARNARIDHFKKHGSEKTSRATEVEAAGSAYHPRIEQAQHTAILERALLELPDEKREILILARYQEMKYEQIAELLGIQVGAVKVRVHRAMAELREIFLRMSGEKTKCDVNKSKSMLRIT